MNDSLTVFVTYVFFLKIQIQIFTHTVAKTIQTEVSHIVPRLTRKYSLYLL